MDNDSRHQLRALLRRANARQRSFWRRGTRYAQRLTLCTASSALTSWSGRHDRASGSLPTASGEGAIGSGLATAPGLSVRDVVTVVAEDRTFPIRGCEQTSEDSSAGTLRHRRGY